MRKDNRAWRKLVKKLRRKRIRQKLASEMDPKEIENDTGIIGIQMNEDEIQQLKEDEENRQHVLEEEIWIAREIQAQLEHKMEQAKQDKIAATKLEEKKKIRNEWEERQRRDKQTLEEKEKAERERKEKQDEEFDNFLSFLSGDVETPPLPYVMPEEMNNGKEICSFFNRTGVCLFADQCSRNHLRPTLSRTILIRNFFSNFSLEQSMLDEYDTDMCLETEDTDMYKEFLEFYNDVLPEFRKIGKVIQFKVCCNFGIHLRGNVYIQYETIRESVDVYRHFNARFYNGRQLSLQFAKIDSWKAAICGLFLRKRCLKGKGCNFLHVFRNPTKEFVSADHDWKENPKREEQLVREKRFSTVSTSERRSSPSRRTSKEHRHRSRSLSRNRGTSQRQRSLSSNKDENSRSARKRNRHGSLRNHKRRSNRSKSRTKHHSHREKRSKTISTTTDGKGKRNSNELSKKNEIVSDGKEVNTISKISVTVPIDNGSNDNAISNPPVKEKHKKSKKSKKKKKKKHKRDSSVAFANHTEYCK